MAGFMKRVAISAGNILTSLGDLETTWQNLVLGKSGLIPTPSPVVTTDYPLGIIPGMSGKGGSLMRLQSLLDSLLTPIPDLPKRCHLIVATTKGAVDELMVPHTTEEGQPWSVAEHVKKSVGLAGETMTVSAACASGTLAIIQGAMRIATGEWNHALIVGVDLVADFILAGFDSLKALSPRGAKPFDQNRDGLSLGDGGGWLLLSSKEHLHEVTDSPLAWLESWGLSCDATHITAPCRNGSGLKLVFEQIRKASDHRMGGVNAHGTGTLFNDAMELLVFKEKCKNLPLCSVKGAIGHSLGAAGVIEALLSVKSLQNNFLPPTVGLTTPAEGGALLSGKECLPLAHPSIVSCNSGFGGINAAIYLLSASS